MFSRIAVGAMLASGCSAFVSPVARMSAARRSLSMSAASTMSEVDEMKFLLGDRSVGSLYDFSAKNAAGEMVDMSKYEGKFVLITNVASL